MKTQILLLAVLISLTIQNIAQNPIPNPGFENWSNVGGWYENPDNWTTSNATFSCTLIKKDNNSSHGNFATQILTYGCQAWAQVKFPITVHPMNMSCYVKTNLAGIDNVIIRIELLNAGNVVDSGSWTNSSSISTYALITVPITQNTSVIDSGIIYLEGGNNYGTELVVDELYFDKVSGIDEKENSTSWTVYPNPLNQYSTLTFENLEKENYTLTLHDLHGRIVRTITDIITDQVLIERANLSSGLYFFHLYSDKNVRLAGKLLIE